MNVHSPATFIGTRVHLLIHANFHSALVCGSRVIHNTMQIQVKSFKFMFTSNCCMVVGARWAGISETAELLRFSHTPVSRVNKKSRSIR